MRLSNLIHLLLATALYAVYFAIINIRSAVPTYLGTDLSLDSTKDFNRLLGMIDTFQSEAIQLLVIAFLCFLVWYFLSEYVIKVDARASAFYTLFCVLLLVIAGAAGYEVYEAGLNLGDPRNYSMGYVATFYFVTSAFFFYLATVLCSPPNARYYIWPAKHIWRN